MTAFRCPGRPVLEHKLHISSLGKTRPSPRKTRPSLGKTHRFLPLYGAAHLFRERTVIRTFARHGHLFSEQRWYRLDTPNMDYHGW